MLEQGTSPPETTWLKRNAQKLVALVFWLILIGLYTGYTLSNDLSPFETFTQLIGFLAGSTWGPLIFIGLYTLRPLVLFSALVLTVGAGFLFGPVLGVVYTIIGANLGASLAFFIGYFLGQGVLEKQSSGEEQSRLERYATRLRHNSFETVLTMRFLFLPYDLVNYLAGFLRIRYLPFILATIIGSLPGTLAFVLFGASTDGDFSMGIPSIDLRVLVASFVIFIASIAFSRLLKRRETQKEA